MLVKFAMCWIVFLTALGSCQLSVTWNGTTITGPVLIYLDELLVDNYISSTIGDLNRPGALVCRSDDWAASVNWYFTDVIPVSTAPRSDSKSYLQTKTASGAIPVASRLSLSRKDVSYDTPRLNGIWHCRRYAEQIMDQIDVGIYSRSQDASIFIAPLFLASSSFKTTPPTFTLHGDTSGGPPTSHTWTRNGEPITDGGPYSISIALNGNSTTVYQQSRYHSVLTVTGNLPGLYQYSVRNRAASAPRISSFGIEGARPTNLAAKQVGLDSVLVTWTETSPPPAMGYRVTAEPGEISKTTLSSHITLATLEPGVYSIEVQSLSQHLPSDIVGPVEVTIRVSDPHTDVSSEYTSKPTSVYANKSSTECTGKIYANKSSTECTGKIYANKSSREVSIAVIVTFVLTLILCAVLRVIELAASKIWRKRKTKKDFRDEIYENL